MWFKVILLTTVIFAVNAECDSICTTDVDNLPHHFLWVTRDGVVNTLPKGHGEQVILGPDYGVHNYRGIHYDHMTVSVNGHVRFGSHDKGDTFHWPVEWMHDQYDIAAVFWADTSNEALISDVYYRYSVADRDRRRFKKDVRAAHGGIGVWKPDYVVVITYVNVDSIFVPCDDGGSLKRRDMEVESRSREDHMRKIRDNSSQGLNTYQIAIGSRVDSDTGEIQTHIIYNYANVCWSDAPYSLAGFYQMECGDRHMYQESFTPEIKNIVNDGNPLTSQYIFRVSEQPNWRDYNPLLTKYTEDDC